MNKQTKNKYSPDDIRYSMMEKIKKMTNKELINEWHEVDQHIRNFSFGKWEMHWQEQLERELDKRDLIY